jgi:phosphoribosylanthranilate isomerase
MTLVVKICGLSTEATLDAALAAGAHMVGFNFVPQSPRYVSPAGTAPLFRRARGKTRIIALCVDADDAFLDDLACDLAPDMVQLHGTETPGRVARIRNDPGLPAMKAIGVAAAADLAQIPTYAAVADLLLLDAKPPKDAAYPGGHGRPFDWAILAGLDPAIPFLLSGGLTPDNVGEAIVAVRGMGLNLVGVDVSSGVESGPGLKDVAKIRDFVAAARAADAAHPAPLTPAKPAR